MKNRKQIDQFVELLFNEYEGNEMYFDEFMHLATTVTSELFVAIYDCIY